MLCGLDAATQLAGPNLQVRQLLLLHEPSQGGRKLQQGEDSTTQHRNFNFHDLCYGSVCRNSYLFAPRREACVTAQPSLQVVGALPVPTQVDGAGLNVDVHQVVDDLALDVILDAVDEETPTHVYHLDEGEIPGGRAGWGEREFAFDIARPDNKNRRRRFTCRADQGPEVGSWFCSIQFFSGNPTWRQSCCSPGSLDTTPSLPAQGGRLSDGK